MTAKERINEKAKELYLKGGFGHEDKYNSSPRHYREGWEIIAKYVLASEIRAVRGALNQAFERPQEILDTIDSLDKQLDELESA